MRMFFKLLFLLIFLTLIGIQFIEVERSNPPVTAELRASPSVKNVFKTSCYDCHSNETKWPFYSKIAPVSFLIVGHVEDGRSKLNFSVWESYGINQKIELKEEIWKEVSEDEMPMKMYTFLHPNSVLTLEQKATIKKWAEGRLQ
ncbi:MAG: heme-binding domain-containing protein [bacterium]